MITGRCECGKVRFETTDTIGDFSHCHCSMCRRLHGAAFASWGGVSKASFRYRSGEDSVKTYHSSELMDRMFCMHCGSSFLSFFKEEPEMIYLAMGILDGNPEHPPGYHFFVGSKVDWIDICDGLPQWEEWPEGDIS